MHASSTLRQKPAESLLQSIDAVVRIRRWQILWNSAARALLAAGLFGLLATVLSAVFGIGVPWTLPLLLSIAALLTASIWSLRKTVDRRQTAGWLDQTFGLNDAILSACQFQELADSSAFHRLQIRHAEQLLRERLTANPVRLNTPGEWKRGLILASFATLLAIPGPMQSLIEPASPGLQISLQQDQQQQIAEELEELAADIEDTSLSDMLKSMNRTLQDFADQQLTPAEAFTALSEMDQTLQQLQQQLDNPESQQQMQQIGEALALSEKMAAAGNALNEGDFRTAAEELSRLQLPELDSSEKRSITEKLQTGRNLQPETPSGRQIAEAASDLAAGIEQDSETDFQQGAEALAAESRKMATRQQLTQLLQQQTQLLAQARSDVEQQVKTAMQGPGKGGRRAGRGSDSDPRGEAESITDAAQEMRLTGTDSGSGDSEKETVEGEAEAQSVSREYRQQSAKYEFLSEQYLETEAVPAGQRQIIRDYFRMIRPRENVPAADTAVRP